MKALRDNRWPGAPATSRAPLSAEDVALAVAKGGALLTGQATFHAKVGREVALFFVEPTDEAADALLDGVGLNQVSTVFPTATGPALVLTWLLRRDSDNELVLAHEHVLDPWNEAQLSYVRKLAAQQYWHFTAIGPSRRSRRWLQQPNRFLSPSVLSRMVTFARQLEQGSFAASRAEIYRRFPNALALIEEQSRLFRLGRDVGEGLGEVDAKDLDPGAPSHAPRSEARSAEEPIAPTAAPSPMREATSATPAIGLFELAPPLLHPTLRKLGLESVQAMADASASLWERAAGVGRIKKKKLDALHATARTMCGRGPGAAPARTPPAAPGRLERLVARGLSADTPWESVLRLAPVRAFAALRGAGIHTLGELVEAVSDSQLCSLANFGRRTLTQLREQLDVIADHGLERYLHGSADDITNASQLAAAMRQVLDERSWSVLSQRAGAGRTLEELAIPMGITRERVRQLERDARAEVQSRFGEVVAELGRQLRHEVDTSPTLVRVEALCAMQGPCTPNELALALELGESGLVVWREAWIATTPTEELDAVVTAARRAIRMMTRPISTDWLSLTLEMSGLRLDDGDVRRLGSEVLRLVWDEHGLAPPPRPTLGNLLADVLDEAEGPLTLDELTRLARVAIKERGLPLRARRRSVQSRVKRDRRILTAGYSRYVHRAHAAVSPAELAAAVEEAVETVKGSKRPVNLRALVEVMTMEQPSLAGLDWRMLHGELARREEIFVWRASPMVGWRATVGARWTSLREDLLGVLRASPSALTLRSMIARLPGRADQAVVASVLQLLDEAVALGRGRYLHRDHIALDEPAIDALLDEVWSSLPPDGMPAGADKVLGEMRERLPESTLEALAADGGAIVWGLARRARRRVRPIRTGAGLLLARRRHPGPLVDACILETLRRRPGIGKAALHRELARHHGYRGAAAGVSQRVDRLAARGAIRREGHRWFAMP
ncbi:MAG: sigma factor-like helix-turn-helix DNA-binding protein [Myxococcota bacterium]